VVVLGWVDGSEIVICEGNWQNPRLALGGYRVDQLMALRCFFWAELGHPPPSNPLTIVFTCLVVYLGSRFFKKGLLRIFPSLRLTFPSGIRPTMVLMTSRTPRLDRSFLRELSLRGQILSIGISLLLLCLARRWPSLKRRDPSRPHRMYYLCSCLNKLVQMTDLNKFLYFVLQRLRPLDRMAKVAMVLTVFEHIGVSWTL